MKPDLGRLNCRQAVTPKGLAKTMSVENLPRANPSGAFSGGNLGPARTGGQLSRKRLQARSLPPLRVVAASAPSTASVATRLIVPELKLHYGERIKCVGESAALGSWYLSAAPTLNWTEGDNWVHTLQLPPGTHEFKLLIARDDGTSHWEEGDNRTIEVPEDVDGVLEVSCNFADTNATTINTVRGEYKQRRYGATETSSNGIFFNDGDALEGREPDSVYGAKSYTNRELEELKRKGDRTSSQHSRFYQGNGSYSNGNSQVNGRPEQSIQFSEKQVEKVKEALGANGEPVRMYGGAEAKELDDGTVLVKFPADDRGDVFLKLVQRLLGDKIDFTKL